MIKHLEDTYGKDKVCHIGTWTEESIYSGIKDFARVLNFPPSYGDRINKELQKLVDSIPGANFNMFDGLEKDEPEKYKAFKKLEKEHAEVFRLARKFEGVIRQWGTHASGIIVSPKTVIDLVPTRIDSKSGDTVALFTGTELEECGILKCDVLGLKNLDIMEDTLKAIGKDFSWLYDTITEDDEDTFNMLCRCESDGVFQIESSMMKGLLKSFQPRNLEDLSALIAVGRPGPLGCGLNKQYAEWKNNPELIKEPLKNTADILARSYGCNIYQEQCMQISMRVCGFNQGQADSIVRKILGKKKAEMLGMLRRMMIFGKRNEKGPDDWENNENICWYDEDAHYGDPIPGAIALGYSQEEMEKFFEDLKGYSSYCFNLSHSLSYGTISLQTGYLKAHYPSQYMAAVLSMQDTDEKKEHYIKVCHEMGIKITAPDINHSGEDFTAIDDHTISYGLSSIKGINNVSEILEKAPYASIEDAQKRISSRSFRKNVAENLIKSGAFDFQNKNRNKLLNRLYAVRDKKEPQISEEFTREDCMRYETETLGSSITYEPAWKSALSGARLSGNCILSGIRNHVAKTSGKKMAMLSVTNETYTMEALLFPKNYEKYKSFLNEGAEVFVSGKKSEDGKLLIDSISLRHEEINMPVVDETYNFNLEKFIA